MKRIVFLFVLLCNVLIADNFVYVNDLANITEAQKEVTGKDVNIGIIDGGVNSNHNSFKDKIVQEIYSQDVGGQDLTPDFQKDTHGSHVGGIMAANKLDGNKPYGVAFDAKLYSAATLTEKAQIPNKQVPDVKAFFSDPAKNIKVINNSWNANVYPIINVRQNLQGTYEEKDYSSTPVLLLATQDLVLEDLTYLAEDQQILMVFATGNEGMISPGINAILPTYDESLRAWLAVGSLSATDDGNTKQFITRENGKLKVTAKGISDFGNGFKGAENYSLMAFGGFINSVDSRGVDQFITMSGTSMAAPQVSGVAALVQQKFPFLNGKQIADTLLSTANKDYIAPKLTVKATTQKDIQTQQEKKYYSIFYIDATTVPNDDNTIKKDLEEAGYTTQEAENILKDRIQINNYPAVQSVSKEAIFGQGILDAKKALGGPSLLDANRLSDADVQNSKTNPNTKEVYYTIDTQGHNGTFSNNIDQKKWDSKLHSTNVQVIHKPQNLNDLNVGFIKKGLGALTLTGISGYAGDTIIQGGELKLRKNSGGSGGELTQSSVFVEDGGKLSGNGTIHKNLYNSGIVRPGNEDLSDLIVKGNYTQEGGTSKLQLDFGNYKNSKLIANSYTIKGGELEYIPLAQYYTSGSSVVIDLGGLEESLKDFSRVSIESNNAMQFKAVLASDNKSVNLNVVPTLKNDAYNVQNSTLGETLRAIRADQDLPQTYKDYFAKIDNASPTAYQSALKSIVNVSHLEILEESMQQNVSFSNQNMFFAIAPDSFVAPEPVKVSSVDNAWHFLEFDKRERFLYITPSYAYLNGENYDGHQYGIQINFAEQTEQNSFALSASFADANLKYGYGDLDKNTFATGINYLHNFEFLRLLSGLSFSYTRNAMDYSIESSQNRLNAKYNTYTISTQLGAAKDFVKGSFVITPLAYFGYDYTYQDPFDENHNALWAKHYYEISHHATSINAGGRFSYLDTLRGLNTKLSFFALQKYQLSGDKISNQMSFIDFPAQNSFTHTQYLNRHITTLGLSYGLFNSSFFVNLSLLSQFAKQHSSVNVFTTFGILF